MKRLLLIGLLISGFCFGQKYELAEDFYSNGLPKAINTYKVSKNKIELIKTVKWNVNGQKVAEKTYKDGKRDGKWTEWYWDQKKKEELTYKDGEQISSRKEWDEDGNLTEWDKWNNLMDY